MRVDTITIPASMPRRSPLVPISWALLAVWLVSSAASFWYMELSDWRSFGSADGAFDKIDTLRVEEWYRSTIAAMRTGGTPAKLTLVHLYNPECRCNRFVDPHLKRLIAHYASLGVLFIAAPSHALRDGAALSDLPVVTEMHSTLARAGVISSPAALIFNADGRLLYYGPYSDSAWCGSAGTLVEPVLERALTGLAVAKRAGTSRGCFCGW